jgi:hypothetical protein
MNVAEFIAICPRVYHAASALAWPSIQEHGLLSTARLLDHFGVDLNRRHELLTRPRTESTRLISPGLSPAVIRDQKPMKFLAEKLEPGTSLEDFLAAINSRVFFWPNRDRLDRLRNAKEYRAEGQVILHVDTRKLVERYEHHIQLCRFNSGPSHSGTTRYEAATLGFRLAAFPTRSTAGSTVAKMLSPKSRCSTLCPTSLN